MRFVERFYQLIARDDGGGKDDGAAKRNLHKTIKKVTKDIEALHFNTAIAALMEFVNEAVKTGLTKDDKTTVVRLIAPLAPHLAEELWENLAQEYSIFNTEWPAYDEKYIEEDKVVLAIQVNGKLRGQLETDKSAEKDEIIAAAKKVENVNRHLEGKKIVKEIYVPNKLVSFVVGE